MNTYTEIEAERTIAIANIESLGGRVHGEYVVFGTGETRFWLRGIGAVNRIVCARPLAEPSDEESTREGWPAYQARLDRIVLRRLASMAIPATHIPVNVVNADDANGGKP